MRYPVSKKPGNPCGHKAVAIAIVDETSVPLCKEHHMKAIGRGDSVALIGDLSKSDLVCHEAVRIGQESPAPAPAAAPKAAPMGSSKK